MPILTAFAAIDGAQVLRYVSLIDVFLLEHELQAAVVGLGSIGELHARILIELGYKVQIVTARKDTVFLPNQVEIFESLDQTVSKEGKTLDIKALEYIVIANETSRHGETLAKLSELGFKGKVLVEKPLYTNAPDAPEKVKDSRREYPFTVYVGYNLRYHPVIERFKEEAEKDTDRLVSAHCYVGQNLNTWRKGRPIQDCYSVSKAMGGGVLRDLSHELDLALHLFGKAQKIKALGGRFTNLTKDSDDVFALLLETENCPIVSMQMNYIDHIAQRTITVNREKSTYILNVKEGLFNKNGVIEKFTVAREDTYRKMHQDVLAKGEKVATLEDGLRVMHMIKEAEREAEREVNKDSAG